MGIIDKAVSAYLTVVHALSLLRPGGKRQSGQTKLNVTVHEGNVNRQSQGKYLVTMRHGKKKVVRRGHRKGVTADHVGVVGGTWYSKYWRRRWRGHWGDEVDEFDTTVHGPWLTRWLIGRHNRHTRVPILQKGDI
uniref:Uncharacterized protein n=1 Tax=Branchiostoma floridae TaxID=7739 RepID=C3ZT47_BRAFL|eukprot:XP_002588242.1 hypothetical protein BRAFLDRAFT_86689 [Branchiostoma floridae]